MEESRIIPRFQVWAAILVRMPFTGIANIGKEAFVFGGVGGGES